MKNAIIWLQSIKHLSIYQDNKGKFSDYYNNSDMLVLIKKFKHGMCTLLNNRTL